LPRAAQWALAAAAFVGGYFLLVEPTLDLTNSLDTRADYLWTSLSRSGDPAAAQTESERVISVGVLNHGDPELATLETGGGKLNERIEAILRDRQIVSLSIKARAPAPLGRGVLQDAVGEGRQVQRQILDIDFEAAPDVAMSILAELEKSKEVASVGRVSLRKSPKEGRNLLQVSVSPEAWVLAPKGASR
jgi:hypothetical protein